MQEKELVTKLNMLAPKNDFIENKEETVIYGETRGFGRPFLLLVNRSEYELIRVENNTNGLLYVVLTRS